LTEAAARTRLCAPVSTSSPDPVAGRHALVAWLAVAVLVAVLVQIDITWPLVGHVGSAAVAVVLLYAPVVVASYRKEDLLDYGFTSEPLGRGLRLGLGVPLVVFPIFVGAYLLFYDVVCGSQLLGDLAPRGACRGYAGTGGLHWPALDWDFAQFAVVQLVVVALPEELFFRGCLHELLERRFPPTRRILGGGVGVALLLSSLAFALIHLPKDGDPRALATFFPGMLFGWMRSATRSILAPTLTHAASNVLVRFLDFMVLR
jgi:membrane protease YdiL (CAAX protease family)